MGKRQVLLSIDDLKKLGIIKKYLRKKRRNKKKKLINNNVRQSSDHMMGYSEVINNQQQIYRNNDLENEMKRKQIKNLEQQNEKNQLLIENPNYFSNPNEDFQNRLMNLENDMNLGKDTVGNIYKIIQDIKQKPASDTFEGKNENFDTIEYKDIFEQVDDQLLQDSNNPMNDIQPEEINIPNQDEIQPTEWVDVIDPAIKSEIDKLRKKLFKKSNDKKYNTEGQYKYIPRNITLLTKQLEKYTKKPK